MSPKLPATACLVLLLSACSEMQTRPAVNSGSDLLTAQPFAVFVQNDNGIAPIVYEFAVEELGSTVRIAENGPANGRIDITFSSSTQSMYIGSASSTSSGYVSGSAWYSGNTTYFSGQGTGTTNTIASGSTLDWQNSTMIVVIRDAAGNRLWSADYKYKGGWELSGWVVNTPAEAARLCLQRIDKKLRFDLHL